MACQKPAPFFLPKRIYALLSDYPAEPTREARSIPKPVQMCVCLYETFLGHIFGFGYVAEPDKRQGDCCIPMTFDYRVEAFDLASQSFRDQLLIAGAGCAGDILHLASPKAVIALILW